MEIVFHTDRINFVRPNEVFIDDYIQLMNDPEVYQFFTADHHEYNYDDEINWINRHQDDYQFTMVDRETQRFIGNLGINNFNDDQCEIGIIICQEFQNDHYGTEALNALIDYIFTNLDYINTIYLVAFSNNPRAIHCYQDLGFNQYDVERNVCTINGENVDDIYMRILR